MMSPGSKALLVFTLSVLTLSLSAGAQVKDVNVVNTPNVNVANTPNVNIANTPAVTLANTAVVSVNNLPAVTQTKSVTEPTSQPYGKLLQINIPDGVVGNATAAVNVPAGKTLVVEYISVRFQLASDQHPTDVEMTTGAAPLQGVQ